MHWCCLRHVAFAWPLAAAVPCAAGSQPECPRGTLPAYAHNDYENARPLADALALGFRGAEADVFLIHGALRVGHHRRAARGGPTLEALYLAPLDTLVARCGPLTADGRPFLLAVEIKEASAPTYDALVALLGRYRALLEAPPAASGAPPAVEIVLVGWHPPAPPRGAGIDTLLGWQHRLRRPDADELARLDAPVRLVSLDYGKTVGRWWVTAGVRRRWLAALRAAKAGAPGRLPVDRSVYAALLDAGVDLIGTERLSETRRLLSAPAAP